MGKIEKFSRDIFDNDSCIPIAYSNGFVCFGLKDFLLPL